ncbi:hypothetical protein JCM8547_005095 [Rhodosporidiobolus lusitaniae]
MAAVRQYGAPTHPLQQMKQAPYDSVGPKSGKSQRYNDESDGLAISYDLHNQQPVYRADVRPDWEANDAPVPRNKPNGNFLSAYDAENDKSNRADSVFDYVDMYDYSDAGDDDFGGEDAQEDLRLPQTAPLRAPNVRQSTQESLETYEEEPSRAQEPWDERGKTGLYGGGGRGADDRETGWVRDYNFSPAATNPGFEEDLEFDDGESVGPKDRKSSRGSRGSRATQGRRAEEERRRSSTTTTPSSYGPITPVSANFNPQQTSSKNAYADSGYRSAGSPPQSSTYSRHTPNSSNGSSHQIQQGRPAPSSVPPVPAPFRPTRVSPSPQPVHTIDPMLIKKKATAAAIPTPSAPMPIGQPGAMPSIKVEPTPTADRPRRKSGFSKWGSRGKKAPTISAPILPEGFVESLGMETFALYPGCKPPAHAILSPVIRDSGDSRSGSPAPARTVSPPAERTVSPPSAPSARKAAPRPLNPTNRPHNVPGMKLGAPQFDRSASPALATPIRLPLDALRDDTDAASEGYPEDAFRRLSKDSDGSYVPAGSQSTKTTHRKFFDGIRQEHGRHEEVQANRAVVPNVPAVPSVPPTRNHDSPSSFNPQAGFSPQTSVRSGGSATASGFRDPWSVSGSNAPSSRSSIHSQRTTGNPRASYHQGGGDRASMASTAHEHDYRKGSYARKNSYVSTHSRLSRHCSPTPSPQPEMPSFEPAHYSPQRDDRNGSVSSAYSEVSEAPPQNDFHPRAHPGFNPSNAVGHLRKNSIAGLSLPPPSSSSSSSHSHGQDGGYAPVAPLNLGRRPSHVYGQNKFGGDVVWGGATVGGPKDVASPIMEASPGMSSGPTIGTTGFRNPFG